jgi:hypothetical protein
MSTEKRILIRGFTLWVLLSMAPQVTAGDDLQDSGSGAVLNVIHSDQLRAVMHRLDSLTHDRERTALELQTLQLHHLEQLLQAADDLLERSEQLPDIAPDTDLTDEEVITFRAMASELYEQTLYINTRYRTGHVSEALQAYKDLRKTCAACHRLFRSP